MKNESDKKYLFISYTLFTILLVFQSMGSNKMEIKNLAGCSLTLSLFYYTSIKKNDYDYHEWQDKTDWYFIKFLLTMLISIVIAIVIMILLTLLIGIDPLEINDGRNIFLFETYSPLLKFTIFTVTYLTLIPVFSQCFLIIIHWLDNNL